MRPDHYATLGVAPGASAEEIRAAYRALLREHHPDRNSSPDAAARTQAIVTAFKVVGDFDQRSYYDWDRRRDREAAEAEAQKGSRRARAGLAAGGVGLAAVGAWLLIPEPATERMATAPTIAAVEEDTPASPTARPARKAAPALATPKQERAIVVRMRPEMAEAAQARAAQKEQRQASADRPMPVVKAAASKPVRTPEKPELKPSPVRVAAKLTPPTRVTPKPAAPVKLAARPAPAAPETARSPGRSAIDLASLDQFVMNFYGQSWRYGDAPRRAVLEQTRAGFVARRGACAADSCRRDAYLKLMRDVSAIVETGRPPAR